MARISFRSWGVGAALALAALVLPLAPALAQEPGGRQEPAGHPDQNREQRMRQMRERMMKDDGAPKPGEVAPAFKIKSLDGKREFALESVRGKRPVVLVFGSYT